MLTFRTEYRTLEHKGNEGTILSDSLEIFKTKEFDRWFSRLPEKTRLIINARLQRIECDRHFGTINTFDEIIELKWNSGFRVYTHRFENRILIILLGGNKNGQSKDIRQAKKILAYIKENGFGKT
jgi:putative addiction module killer protein